MPDNQAALDLIRSAGRALAAPSANPFGYVSPTEARHVADQLGDQVDLILDGGKCRVGLESTVLSLADNQVCILRPGGVPVHEIEDVIGPVSSWIGTAAAPRSPGQLVRHYATRTPLKIMPDRSSTCSAAGERVGLLAFTPPSHPECYASVELLTESGSLREAAANLFSALHSLDRQGLDRIEAHPVPEQGLGVAIMDRLRRCAAGR
jgi:L-threonylcarbamoyladenylate synthase